MEELITALLLGAAGVTAICGQRVNWNERPQGDALPAIVLSKVSGPRGYTLTGADGLTGFLVQLECWALSKSEAVALARAVEATLSGYQAGQLRGVFIEDERDGLERDGPTTFHQVSQDLRVWHKAA